MDGLRRLLAVLFVISIATLPVSGQGVPPPQGQGVSVGALVERIGALEVQVIETNRELTNLRASLFRTIATKSTQEVFVIVCFLIGYDSLKYIIKRYAIIRALGNARRYQDERASSLNAELEEQLKAERLRRIAIEDTLAATNSLNEKVLKTNANIAVLDDAMASIVGETWMPIGGTKTKQVATNESPKTKKRWTAPPWFIRIIAVAVPGALLIIYLGARP